MTVNTIPCKIFMKMSKQQSNWDKKKIKALRQHLGLTQTKLAEKMGTRQQTISEWEIGMYQPRGTSSTLLTIIAESTEFKYKAR